MGGQDTGSEAESKKLHAQGLMVVALATTGREALGPEPTLGSPEQD